MKIGIFPNESKDVGLVVTRRVCDYFAEKGIEPLLEEHLSYKISSSTAGRSIDHILSECEMVITLGGDGTLLNVARHAAKYNVPICGVNLGNLGFMAEIEVKRLEASLDRLIRKDYEIEERMMLEAEIKTDDDVLERYLALNDFVVTSGNFSRVMSYSLTVNDSFIDVQVADGVIISTPTGSTAYSLSAGGPVISPNVNAVVITPICAHTLHARSIVVSDRDIIKIGICDKNTDVVIAFDGQRGYKLHPGDEVTIYVAKYKTQLLRLSKYNFYDVLRSKMNERVVCNQTRID